MQTQTDKPARQPIIEPWRIVALALLAAASMLFVHVVVPADAGSVATSAASSGTR